jgi:hypothetical protein
MSCSRSTRFQLLDARRTGVDFQNTITESDTFNVLTYEYVYNGAGVGVGDLNNDGLPDLVFAGNQVASKVYLNSGDFRFRDITAGFQGLTNDQWYSSVTIVDINSDGWLDVYMTSTRYEDPGRCKNRLWINQGIKENSDPIFVEMAEQYGIAHNGQSVHASFFDYDRDGDLDLYVMNNTVNSRMNTSYRPKVLDGTAMNNDRLFRNNGDNNFTDVTIEAGIVYEGFGLGLALGDVNKDGYPDIYISNDFISNDLLYINQGNGTFRNEITKYMSYQAKSSMGNDMADVNNDGFPDMFTLDMLPESYAKKRQTINGFNYRYYVNDYKYGFEHQLLRNQLHLHNGFMNGEMLPYSEVGQMVSGIYNTEWSWSPLWADYDNDGDKDLIVANGFLKDMTDKDWTKYKADFHGSLLDDQEIIDYAPAVKVANIAFENTGELKFTRKNDWLPDIPSYSYGASFVDLDNDGDLDYIANNINDKAFILKNNTIERSEKKAGFIRVKLTGKAGNTMALGAKVELWCKGKYQFVEHFLTRGYASSVDPVVHFGLSGETLVDSIKVTWPASGYITMVRNIVANRIIEINEETSEPDKKTRQVNALMFSRQNDILNYIHEQTDYVDFYLNQYIIPHKFSQIGPRMAKGDLNGDGLEDLIIGSTNIQPTRAFIRKGNGFEEAVFKGLTAQREFSEADFAIIDIDGDGDNDVAALAGGYENKDESEYQHYLYKNENGSFERTPLPIPQFPASVIRPCDFDHDGDIDLFVGSRVKKGMFPYANHSWLILNNKGSLAVDSASRIDLGMVTDAVWTDYNMDGWKDLLVAREWNSLVMMKNADGKKLVFEGIPALESQHGIWYSVVAGDFDQDGDDDYIAGNLGENHRFTVSDQYPMSLYAIDLEMDGNIDPLTTAYWEDQQGKMTEYPVNYLDELISQSTLFQRLFNDYKSFSYVGFNEMIDESIMERLDFKLHVNTTSSYILWNNKGTLSWEKLPRVLQVSPVTKMIVRDLNNDKYPDVLIGGNDHTYDVSTGYYDASKGFVLLSKGTNQAFDVLTPAQSGLLLHGMVESLLAFDSDSSLIVVAGFNRAKAGVFEMKRKGKQ